MSTINVTSNIQSQDYTFVPAKTSKGKVCKACKNLGRYCGPHAKSIAKDAAAKEKEVAPPAVPAPVVEPVVEAPSATAPAVVSMAVEESQPGLMDAQTQANEVPLPDLFDGVKQPVLTAAQALVAAPAPPSGKDAADAPMPAPATSVAQAAMSSSSAGAQVQRTISSLPCTIFEQESYVTVCHEAWSCKKCATQAGYNRQNTEKVSLLFGKTLCAACTDKHHSIRWGNTICASVKGVKDIKVLAKEKVKGSKEEKDVFHSKLVPCMHLLNNAVDDLAKAIYLGRPVTAEMTKNFLDRMPTCMRGFQRHERSVLMTRLVNTTRLADSSEVHDYHVFGEVSVAELVYAVVASRVNGLAQSGHFVGSTPASYRTAFGNEERIRLNPKGADEPAMQGALVLYLDPKDNRFKVELVKDKKEEENKDEKKKRRPNANTVRISNREVRGAELLTLVPDKKDARLFEDALNTIADELNGVRMGKTCLVPDAAALVRKYIEQTNKRLYYEYEETFKQLQRYMVQHKAGTLAELRETIDAAVSEKKSSYKGVSINKIDELATKAEQTLKHHDRRTGVNDSSRASNTRRYALTQTDEYFAGKTYSEQEYRSFAAQLEHNYLAPILAQEAADEAKRLADEKAERDAEEAKKAAAWAKASAKVAAAKEAKEAEKREREQKKARQAIADAKSKAEREAKAAAKATVEAKAAPKKVEVELTPAERIEADAKKDLELFRANQAKKEKEREARRKSIEKARRAKASEVEAALLKRIAEATAAPKLPRLPESAPAPVAAAESSSLVPAVEVKSPVVVSLLERPVASLTDEEKRKRQLLEIEQVSDSDSEESSSSSSGSGSSSNKRKDHDDESPAAKRQRNL